MESVITFGIAAWYGNCSQTSRNKLTKVIKYAKRLNIENVKTLQELYEKSTLQKAKAIRSEKEHPLYNCYQTLRSGGRLQAEYTRTARYNRSFVPASIRLINNL